MQPFMRAPCILQGNVTHKRLFPKVNQFFYGIYYLLLPIKQLDSLPSNIVFGINRKALMSFYSKDHGDKDSPDLWQWVMNILRLHDLDAQVDEVLLLSMPRLWGYVFNPISFWLCIDKENQLRAVLCEVNNTFGEQHSYLCYADNQQPITEQTLLAGDKMFHVSPFMPRDGHYEFRFDNKATRKTDKDKIACSHFHAVIDYFHQNGQKQLKTSLAGYMYPLSNRWIMRAFISYPVHSFRVIILIHWQAVKLFFKKIKFFKKPSQYVKKVSIVNKTTDKSNK